MPSDPPCNLDDGNTTWILVSTIFVLGMCPALAFFEAGMLRSKHTLSIITQIFVGNSVLSVMWLCFGYSLSFGPSILGLIGAPTHLLWIDVPYDKCSRHSNTVPAALHALFQMMFACITPLLMTGSYAERLRFDCFLAFTILWEIVVYYPVCHWIWGGGFLAQMGVLDFAGGIVIHTSAGAGALVAAVYCGRRKDFYDYMGECPPSNLPLAASGAALLWMGWFGFNGGSALAAGTLAVSAVVSTHVGGCCSAVVWLLLSMKQHRPASTGIFNGVLAGLAGITPASGYVNTQATILIGLLCGVTSYYGVQFSKGRLHIDDALDVHWVHGFTGALGSIVLGIFGQKSSNVVHGYEMNFHGTFTQVALQVFGVTVVGVYAGAMTLGILWCLEKNLGPLSHTEDKQQMGLDWVDHGEVAYHRLNVLALENVQGEDYMPTEDEYRRHKHITMETLYAVSDTDVSAHHNETTGLISRGTHRTGTTGPVVNPDL
eukprot:CAMPEP_0181328724 /NCGR_PEP_ID=MMETSP1101-20121128/22894_1 /TAXON_ID=46948 /ORGANISM="Rhodomonas abbreviata, Strain Caron Lab Isolate" /LENGTH=486 /DNA_ID=CAMNT_0023437683 /DNA_START=168 /DNA_END=1628 /DNA_ORIENTATION=+